MTHKTDLVNELKEAALALCEAVLLPLTDSHVNLHPAVPLAVALRAKLASEPEPLTDPIRDAALLPCPFCGAPGQLIDVRQEGVEYDPPVTEPWWASCSNRPTATGGCPVYPSIDGSQATPALAAAMWNTRASLTTEPERETRAKALALCEAVERYGDGIVPTHDNPRPNMKAAARAFRDALRDGLDAYNKLRSDMEK